MVLIRSLRLYRRDTAHVMNNDGTNKPETTDDDARRVRESFSKAFVEGVKALQ